MGKIGKISVVVTAVFAFIFIAACTGGNVWTKDKQCIQTLNTFLKTTYCIEVESGLWKACTNGVCASHSGNGYYKTVRAFTMLSTLAMVVSIVLAVVGLLKEDFKPLFASIFAFISAVCALIGLAVFAGETTLVGNSEYGWSFIIGWVGMLVAVVSGILGFLTEKC